MNKKLTIFILVLLIHFGGYAQRKHKIEFCATIIDGQDTLENYTKFYLVTHSDTIHPNVHESSTKMTVSDSFVDFHLKYKDKTYYFRNVEVFRLFSGVEWEIHPIEEAKESLYQIIARQAGLFCKCFGWFWWWTS